MRMATALTAMGKPLPYCPYVFPSSDDATPSAARVVARPKANAVALHVCGYQIAMHGSDPCAVTV